MEEPTKAERSLSEYLDILRRRRWQLIIPASLLFLAAALLAAKLPAVYLSTGTILIEQQGIPEELVRSTITSYADQRIQTISQRVMTIPNLSGIIEEFDLYREARETATMATLVNRMRNDIHLEMVSADVVDPRSGRATEATIAFKLGFESSSPEVAQKVANEVVSLFLDENLRSRQKVAKEASVFLAEEAAKLGQEIAKLEAKLAVFKEEHAESLPEMQDVNLRKLERLETQIRSNESQRRVLDERVIYLQSELAQIDPYSHRYSSTGERILSSVDRLKLLETEYVVVASRYSASHPDRINMEREIEALRNEVGSTDIADLQRKLASLKSELTLLEDRYSPDHPDVKRKQRAVEVAERQISEARNRKVSAAVVEDGDNPAYVQLSAQLQAARAEQGSLKLSYEELIAEIKSVERRLAEAPKIESEYLRLTRDYENANQEFANVKEKEMTANLAESLEVGSKAERFVLIEPPVLPNSPLRPNRLAVLFLGFAVSIAGGVGHVALREGLDQSIHGAKGVAKIIGAAPICTVPYITTGREIAWRRTRTLLVFVSLLALLIGAIALVHYLYRPIDLVYFQTLQKLDLI